MQLSSHQHVPRYLFREEWPLVILLAERLSVSSTDRLLSFESIISVFQKIRHKLQTDQIEEIIRHRRSSQCDHKQQKLTFKRQFDSVQSRRNVCLDAPVGGQSLRDNLDDPVDVAARVIQHCRDTTDHEADDALTPCLVMSSQLRQPYRYLCHIVSEETGT